MKFKYYWALLGLLSTPCLANNIEITIPSLQIQEAGIPRVKPQLFIFDQSQSLIFHRSSVTRDLIKKFQPGEELSKKASLKSKILKFVPEEHKFEDVEYTLVFLTDPDAENFCPPCVTQEKINQTVISRLKGHSISYIKINQLAEGSRILEILTTEEFESRFGKIK